MISFDNTEIAFKSKSNKDLKRAYWLFKAVGNRAFVKFGKWATNLAFKLRLPINGLIKKTIFHQFCGGESVEGSIATSDALGKHNVKTILDYSIEGKTSDDDFDATVAEIIETIEAGKANDNIPFAVFKMTGICLFSILEKANNGVDKLSGADLEKYEQLISRVDQICSAGHRCNVPVFVDAEESWIQETIDRIAKEMMLRYNKESAIVYNTLQMYRHDRMAYFQTLIDSSKADGHYLGVKIVRGAYMEKERKRAEEKGYPSPIQPTKEASDTDFDRALRLAADHIDIVGLCAGSHNEKSAMLLTEIMAEKQLPNNHPSIYFAQLLGMSDHISFNLANAGYNVAKYVPYGPIKEVMPYLLRRADENTSVSGQTSRELALIMSERKRRKK
ncbi:MAG: proline dehydrogenase family protein [Crocinitomicaceae bacterium]|nr:proline dehydrogenase family protein [Flavobacteriales bacterium]NQZ35056.1 proline dehydrogenase family protein [Crocinitomicaceae bacterium]